MTVTSPAGFRAAGVTAGLKPSGKPDVALVVNDGPRFDAAGVFTSNRVKAAPVRWCEALFGADAGLGAQVGAVILNSGGANACTGQEGYQDTVTTAEHVGAVLSLPAQRVAVASTGLIGMRLPMDLLLTGVGDAHRGLSVAGGQDAATAIMTTDTVPKTVVVQGQGFTVGGMAKGAGMLAPGLATMLVVLTTDAVADGAALDTALRHATKYSFDRLDSDGCMSTNDQVTLLVSGASDVVPDADEFRSALVQVCTDLAVQLQADAEGASHNIAIRVVGAESEDDAVEVGRSVARNNLFKAAIFGNDPNWGRVLAAIGTTRASFDPYAVDVSFNGVRLCSDGAPDRPREEVDLTPRATDVLIDLKAGEASATIFTNDLTHDYVHENSAYSS